MSKFVDLYGHDGHLLGKLCLETGRVQIGYLFYAQERTCEYIGDEISGGCSVCRGWLDPACAYCPSCGAKVVER